MKTLFNYRVHLPLATVLAGGLIVFAGGCSTNPPADVVAQVTRTETSIAQAEQAGALQGALPELQRAKDKLAAAQQAFGKHDYDVTLRLAQEAQLDAQYAAAKAQTAQAQKAAVDVQQSLDTLRQEASRSSGS